MGKEEVPIIFGTYNIRNGRNGGLESALRGMAQANIDLGIFQETKCTDGIYTRESAGYRVVTTDAPSGHSGRVALFYRPSPLFEAEAVGSTYPTSSASRSRRERSGGTSSDVTSPLTTLRQ